jgi:hypothetical protein
MKQVGNDPDCYDLRSGPTILCGYILSVHQPPLHSVSNRFDCFSIPTTDRSQTIIPDSIWTSARINQVRQLIPFLYKGHKRLEFLGVITSIGYSRDLNVRQVILVFFVVGRDSTGMCDFGRIPQVHLSLGYF